MEMQGSAWPTLLQGENPTWALHIVSTLRGRGPSWRYLFIGSTLLLHHRPSDTTLHLEPWTNQLSATVTLRELDVVHSAFLIAERRATPSVLNSLRLASDQQRIAHERASAGSSLELLVRKSAIESEIVSRNGWSVRGDGVVVLCPAPSDDDPADHDRTLGEVAEDGFRLTPGGPPLQDMPRSSAKATVYYGSMEVIGPMITTLPRFPIAFPISAAGEVEGALQAAARARSAEY